MGYFKSNKQFYSIALLKNSIVLTFLFRHQTNFFQLSNWGNLDFLPKSFLALTTGVNFINTLRSQFTTAESYIMIVDILSIGFAAVAHTLYA